MHLSSSALLLLSTLLLGLIIGMPVSGRDLNQDQALALSRSGEILRLEQLLQHISQLHPRSQLLEVELEEEHGRYIYEIELLTLNGQTYELELDASTGELLENHREDD